MDHIIYNILSYASVRYSLERERERKRLVIMSLISCCSTIWPMVAQDLETLLEGGSEKKEKVNLPEKVLGAAEGVPRKDGSTTRVKHSCNSVLIDTHEPRHFHLHNIKIKV